MSSRTKFSAPCSEELQSLALKLKGHSNSQRVWNEVLTAREREQSDWSEFSKQHCADAFQHLRRVSQARALVELGHDLELLTSQRYQRLLAEIGEADRTSSDVPRWDRDRCELMLRGQIVRTLRSRSVARNLALILDTFEELKWPARIDDPLPGGANPQRLRESIRSLNSSLRGLRFRADGTGEGIIWELA